MSSHALNRRSMLRVTASLSAMGLIPAELLVTGGTCEAWAADLPKDSRIGALKDLNGYFPFSPPATPQEWDQRREYVRRQILVACGLWPMPERPPIQATVHGRVEREDYTVDRVYFESSPGLLVTGSLYLPKKPVGKLPVVLCPHGHWQNGRFHDHGPEQLKREIESGGEKFETGGRHPLQARCVQLARMGCMVFIYDMLGYADGSSLTQELAHGFSRQRPQLSSPERWGLFSAQSELRCLNALGLQTWNSIRALDWLTSRNDCDASRIGVTGASGGGTQTFLLTAIDERVTAAFPAVMVSTAMQGGCTCENASYLRVNTGNIEFAAMAAPRPIAMTGADDWTVEIETKGLPELKKHFAMLGVPDNVAAKYFKFPHNYNHPSRMLMYEFFNRTLKLGVAEIAERDYAPLSRDEATVFNAEHPAPPKTEDAEVALLQSLDQASRQQIAALTPTDASSLKEFRRVIGGALEIMIGRSFPTAGSVSFEKSTEDDRSGYRQFSGVVKLMSSGEEVPTVFALPENWNQQVVLWLDGQGKSGLLQPDGTPIPAVAALLKSGFAVGSSDLYLTGDFTPDGKPVTQIPIVKNPREFLGYTLGYNHPLFSQRVHDVLTLAAAAKYHPQMPAQVHLVGVHGAGPIVAAAAATAGSAIQSVAVDTAGYRFAAITDYRDPGLLPGAVKYGDLPAILALCSPVRTAVTGETEESLSVAVAAFRASGGSLNILPSTADPALALSSWLVSKG